jgi:peptidoglycan biosynthesis protein MviN/MurJ (putative lipid II flippase)
MTRLALVFVVSLVGKLLGFVRVQQIAMLLGFTIVADALLLTLQVTSLWDVVFLSGGVGAVALPRLVVLRSRGAHHQVPVLVGRLTATTSAYAITFGLCLALFANAVARVLAPGFDEKAQSLFAWLCVLSAALPLAMNMLVMIATINRIYQRPVLFSVNPIVINGVSLAALWLAARLGSTPFRTAEAFVIAISVSSLAMTIAQALALPAHMRKLLVGSFLRTFLSFSRLAWFDVHVRRVLLAAVPVIAAVLLQSMLVLVNYSLASTVGPGAVATLGYAERLANVVFSVLVGALFVVLEPHWADRLWRSREGLRDSTIADDLLGVMFSCLPFVAILAYAAPEVSTIVYRVDVHQDRLAELQLGRLAGWFGVALLPMTLAFSLSRVLIAVNRTKQLLIGNAALMLLYPVLGYALLKIGGLPGLGIAFAVLMLLQSMWYGLVIARTGRLGDVCTPASAGALIIGIAATMVCARAAAEIPLAGLLRALAIATVATLATLVTGYVVRVTWIRRLASRLRVHN